VNASYNKVVRNQIQDALDAMGRKDKTLSEFNLFWRRFIEAHEEVAKVIAEIKGVERVKKIKG